MPCILIMQIVIATIVQNGRHINNSCAGWRETAGFVMLSVTLQWTVNVMSIAQKIDSSMTLYWLDATTAQALMSENLDLKCITQPGCTSSTVLTDMHCCTCTWMLSESAMSMLYAKFVLY